MNTKIAEKAKDASALRAEARRRARQERAREADPDVPFPETGETHDDEEPGN